MIGIKYIDLLKSCIFDQNFVIKKLSSMIIAKKIKQDDPGPRKFFNLVDVKKNFYLKYIFTFLK